MLNLPNLITLGRIILIPLFIIVFWSSDPYRIQYSMLIFAVAGISDILDGYLARSLNLVTNLGKALDPLADKLMVITALFSLFLENMMPLWLLLLIVFKEIIIILGSLFIVVKQNSQVVSANIYGKAATFAVYLAIFTQAFKTPYRDLMTYIAGLAAVIAFINYLLIFLRNTNDRPV